MNIDGVVRRGSRALAVITLMIGAAACGTVARTGAATGRPARQLSGSIQEFPLLTAQTSPRGRTLGGLTFGPDGALWFTETVVNSQTRTQTGKIGRMTSAGKITEFSLAGAIPRFITTGPDGDLWFTESYFGSGASSLGPQGKIGRITPKGELQEFALPSPGTDVQGITTGPDQALWFVEQGIGPQISTPIVRIGRITPSGTVSEFPVPGTNLLASSIAAGPSQSLWFIVQAPDPTAQDIPKLGRLSTGGVIQLFPLTPEMFPGDLVAGPDGNVWFTELTRQGPEIGRMTPTGTETDFPLPMATQPSQDLSPLPAITAGPDGALWFTDAAHNAIGRITTAGAITEYPLPTPNAYPGRIVTGPDGTLWFTEPGAWKMGHLR